MEGCLRRSPFGGNSSALSDRDNLKNHVLLVEADEAFGQILQQFLGQSFVLHVIPPLESGVTELYLKGLGAVLLNWDLLEDADRRGICPLLRVASERLVPVIVYSWDHRRETMMNAFQQGAADFLEQPLDIGVLRFALEAACRRTSAARQLAAASGGPTGRNLLSHRRVARQQQGDGAGGGARSQGCWRGHDRTDHRRKWNGQRDGRGGDPSIEPSC